MEIITEIIKIEEIKDFEEIYKNLHYGINLPILDVLKEHIRTEFMNLNVTTLLIKNSNGRILGHTCIFDYENIMYFGFFSVMDDQPELIIKLAVEVKSIALIRGCKKIEGPINLPIYAYGWGFAEEGSSNSIFAAGPYNAPIYGEIFASMGYSVKHRILKYRFPFIKTGYKYTWEITLPDLKDSSKYMEWYPDFLDIQGRLYADNIKITPKRTFDIWLDYLKFTVAHGYPEMAPIIYDDQNSDNASENGSDKNYRKMAGVACMLPNVFDLDTSGRCKSTMMMGVAVEQEYRRKGVFSNLLYGVIDGGYNCGLTHGEATVDETNTPVVKTFEKNGGKLVRKHVVMELRL